jgi:hypothetical protein
MRAVFLAAILAPTLAFADGQVVIAPPAQGSITTDQGLEAWSPGGGGRTRTLFAPRARERHSGMGCRWYALRNRPIGAS